MLKCQLDATSNVSKKTLYIEIKMYLRGCEYMSLHTRLAEDEGIASVFIQQNPYVVLSPTVSNETYSTEAVCSLILHMNQSVGFVQVEP